MNATNDRRDRRRREVAAAIADIRAVMASGPSLENLAGGKARLIELASDRELFSFGDFPLPGDGAMERSYLIHEDDDGGYALYVNAGAPHQRYAPHDHGNAWAIIAGVEGRERHRFYERRGGDGPGAGQIVARGEAVVAPGEAVTMRPDGVHEVEAMDGEPLLHLHLYAGNFVSQGKRWKYDPETGAAEPFLLDELGSIVDAR